MSKPSTKASKKYQEKVGLIASTYKLKANIVSQFKEACQAKGESQASVLTSLMKNYINGVHPTRVYPIKQKRQPAKTKAQSDTKIANEKRRNQVRDLLLKHPDKSNLEIVRMGDGAFAKDTVRRVRDALIKAGEIEPVI
ncbi:MAG: hypothetical protein FWC91_12325 [Defluviitaleaceae bacterium]|nr:hypothetical protein [Defluviitaleaceae bacterium]